MKMQKYRLVLYKNLKKRGIHKIKTIDYAPCTPDYIKSEVQKKTEMGYTVLKYIRDWVITDCHFS
jgi:hypothetical protein